MKLTRLMRLTSILLMVASGGGLLVSGSPAGAQAVSVGSAQEVEQNSSEVKTSAVEYFKVPYGDDVYRVSDFGASNVSWRKLSFADWVAAGGPTPKPMPAAYVKYSWSGDIYAVTFFNSSRSNWLWQHLSPAQWQRAGYPKPSVAG